MERAINFDIAGGIDVARLERSLALKGRRVGEGRYHFTGGAQEHWVDLYTQFILAATAAIICGASGSASTSSLRCCEKEMNVWCERSALSSSACEPRSK